MPVLIEKYESKKAKNGFMYRYIIPRNLDYGIEKPIKKRGFSTKREAKEAGELVLHEIMNGQKPDSRRITLDDVWQEYLELNPNKIKPQTMRNYRIAYNKHIQPKLGNRLIRSLDYKTLQKFFNEVKPSRAKIIKQVINTLMTLAVRLGYIQFSPTREIILPKVPEEKIEKKIDYLEDSEFYALIDSIKHEKYRRMLWIGYYMGLRLGECLGLDWDDINMETGKVFIHQQELPDGTISQSLKTPSSKAVLPIAPPLLEMMKEWKKDGCPYLIHNKKGERVMHKAAQRFFREHRENFHFHIMRHTFITNLVKAGVPVKTVMKLARHSNIEMTLQFYTEVTEDMMEDAISKAFPILPQKDKKDIKYPLYKGY